MVERNQISGMREGYRGEHAVARPNARAVLVRRRREIVMRQTTISRSRS